MGEILQSAFFAQGNDAAYQRLLTACQHVKERYDSSTTEALESILAVGEWRASRSAIAGLKKHEHRALGSVPVVAAWFRQSLPQASIPAHDYALDEAVRYLAQQRTNLDQIVAGTDDSAVVVLRGFLDEQLHPFLLGLLAPPLRTWQRGVVAYLHTAPVNVSGTTAALTSFVRSWGPGETTVEESWHGYLRQEAIDLLVTSAAITPEPPQVRSGQVAARDDGSPVVADEQDTASLLVTWAVDQLRSPSTAQKRNGLQALRRLGLHGRAGERPVVELLTSITDGSEPASALRREALDCLFAIMGPAERPALRHVEAAERLINVATDDPAVGVRVEALDALARTPIRTATVVAVALRAIESQHEQERSAAVRLLGIQVD